MRLTFHPTDTLDHHSAIDPFSNAYWQPPKPKNVAGPNELSAVASTVTPSLSVTPADSGVASQPVAMAPPPAPADAFQALGQLSAGGKKAVQQLSGDLQEELKNCIRSNPNLSKVGIIELFSSQSSKKCTKAQVKSCFELVTEKSGKVYKVKGDP